MSATSTRLLAGAALLVLVHVCASVLGWDVGLDALTGMGAGVSEAGQLMRALMFALSWFGAVALAPILALAGALLLLVDTLEQRAAARAAGSSSSEQRADG